MSHAAESEYMSDYDFALMLLDRGVNENYSYLTTVKEWIAEELTPTDRSLLWAEMGAPMMALQEHCREAARYLAEIIADLEPAN